VAASNAAAHGSVDDEDDERGPLRRCVVTRERGRPPEMLRFVVSPDRVLTPDLAARLPGRGIWLSARGDVLETARKRGAFARAARGPVTVPADLDTMLRDGLVRRMVDVLGLARRAGQAVFGFTKAREWVVAHKAGLIVRATDGSEAELGRLLSGAGHAFPVASALTGDSLGAVFGRDHVVHVAVMAGSLADRLVTEHRRYAGLTGTAQAATGSRENTPAE